MTSFCNKFNIESSSYKNKTTLILQNINVDILSLKNHCESRKI